MGRPTIVFVCVKNGGKSQMAAGLARALASDSVEVLSAGTRPGDALNEQSRQSLAQIGASLDGEYPKPLDAEVLRRADRVIVLGSEAVVTPVEGMTATVETWETDEPSTRGIEGMERMRLIRDDIHHRVTNLLRELAPS